MKDPFAFARELGGKGMMSQLHRPFVRTQFDGRARRVTNDLGWLERALLAFGAGMAAGCFFTVGLAWLWSWFL